MTITAPSTTATNGERRYDYFDLVTFDLYRDIHKGIRNELFALTTTAGNLDPADGCGRAALAAHVAAVKDVLELHAEHEDVQIDPLLAEHAPSLAERITVDHEVLEARFSSLNGLAADFASAGSVDQRRLGHLLYLELSTFTSAYLEHQAIEERVVMPVLEQAVGLETVIAVHQAIVASIPPQQMAQSLAFMLPAMNVDDRTELLGGMRMAAPPEAFAAVVDLASSVLPPADVAALVARLELN